MKIPYAELRGFYKETVDTLVDDALEHGDGQLVLNVYGSSMAGRTTVACAALEKLGLEFEKLSLYDISTSGWSELIKKVSGVKIGVFTDYDDIDETIRVAFQDVICDGRINRLCPRRIWIVISSSGVGFADKSFYIPQIGLHPVTVRGTLDALLGEFTVMHECPIKSVIEQVCRKLRIGEISTIVSTGKLLAVGDGEALSCKYIAQAIDQLNLHSSPLESVHESCDVFRSSGQMYESGFKSFIGLGKSDAEKIEEYLHNRTSMLIIEGPVGCGKTHLAHLIARSATPNDKHFVCITSADILRSKIGESEKFLHNALVQRGTSCVIIEDMDQLFPCENSQSTGSVQRCLPVFISFLDRQMKNKLVIGTARRVDGVHERVVDKGSLITLSNKLSFEDKLALIQTQSPDFNKGEESHSVTPFDLIGLTNRSQCVQFGKEAKLDKLRKFIARQV